jgi:hypothetical protein
MVRKFKKYVTKTRKLQKRSRNTRKLNKIGGVGTAERLALETKKKASGIFSKLDDLININREYTENIYSKIQELKTLYGVGIQAEPEYDMGQAEHLSPSYDIAQAEHASPSYDIAAAAEDPEYVLLDPVVSKEAGPLTKGQNTWKSYILKILDNEPKSENEISALMKEKYPERMTGKTPEYTLNTTLQILVRDGYAKRNQYKKGSRKIYKYYI